MRLIQKSFLLLLTCCSHSHTPNSIANDSKNVSNTDKPETRQIQTFQMPGKGIQQEQHTKRSLMQYLPTETHRSPIFPENKLNHRAFTPVLVYTTPNSLDEPSKSNNLGEPNLARKCTVKLLFIYTQIYTHTVSLSLSLSFSLEPLELKSSEPKRTCKPGTWPKRRPNVKRRRMDRLPHVWVPVSNK